MALATLALWTCAASPAAAQTRCGVERWPVKIGADEDAPRIERRAMPTTVAELVALPRPTRDLPQRRRAAPAEFQTYLLRARLARIIVEDDGDLHVVLRDLEDERLTLVAEIPHPGCAADSTMGERFTAARLALRRVPRDGIVEVIGVGFFDYLHGQSGMARNGLEIHPVVALRGIRP